MDPSELTLVLNRRLGSNDHALETAIRIRPSICRPDFDTIDFLVAVTIRIQADLDASVAALGNDLVWDWNMVERSVVTRGDRFAWLIMVEWLIMVAFAALVGTRSSAEGQQPAKPLPQRPLRENVTLPVDSHLLKQLGTAEDLLSDQRGPEAIGVLQEVAQAEGKGLVQVRAGTAGGVGNYLNVGTRCNILMSQVSADSLRSYRQKIDPQAKKWWENWQRTRDENELVRIVRQAFLSSYGDDALNALAETSWDRGDYSAARLFWEQLIPLPVEAKPVDYPTVLRFPDTDFHQAVILARLIHCSILDQNFVAATKELRQFSAEFSDAEGWLAGQQGRLVDRLQQILDAARQWRTVRSTPQVETFGMSPARFRIVPDSLDVGSLCWVHPFSANRLTRPVDGRPFQNVPLSSHPVVYDDGFEKIVFVNDSNSIRAWNLLTGKPAWKSEQADPAAVYTLSSEESGMQRNLLSVGVPAFSMTIANRCLYARMGSPVTCPATQQIRDLASDLVCLDLTQEGKLVWNIAARELFPGETWRFEGTPLILAGRAYVTVCRRNPQLELMVVCLDASDGRLLWQRPVGGFRTSVNDSHHRVSHLLLTAGGGRLFLSSDCGAIVAMDPRDGRLEWAITYESRAKSLVTLSDPTQNELLPPLFANGLLFVAPKDADTAFCIEADSGRVRWKYSYLTPPDQNVPEILRQEWESTQLHERQWRYLLGVVPGGVDGRLIVSGESLAAIDIESGRAVWQQSVPAVGRGILAGDQILITEQNSLEIRSQQTGERIRKIELNTPDSPQQGGNLTIAHGMLLITQHDRLAAFGDFSQMKERIEQDLTLAPHEAGLLMQLGQLESLAGRTDVAERVFDRLLSASEQDDPSHQVVRQKLGRWWYDAGISAFDQADHVLAQENWTRALAVADQPTLSVELTFRLAQVDELVDRPIAAVARYQSLLDQPAWAMSAYGALTAGNEAANRISQMIAKHGREVYAEIEAAADRQFERLKTAPNSGDIQQIIDRYPHARMIVEARKRLAESHLSQGNESEAFAIFAENQKNASDKQDWIQSTVSMVEVLQQTGRDLAAARLASTLEGCDPRLEVLAAGRTHKLGEMLSAQFRPRSTEPTQLPMEVERTWIQSLAPDAKVIFTENDPPSAKLAAVLICTKQDQTPQTWSWQCVDWQTGQIRWEVKESHAIQIASWTPMHLVIGTGLGWQGRSPEDGRQIWNQSGSAEVVPFLTVQKDSFGNPISWPSTFDRARGFQLFDPNQGELMSRISLPFSPSGLLHDQYAIGGVSQLGLPPRIVDSESVVSGKPSGDHSRPVSVDQSVVAFFQTIRPIRTWVADAASPRGPWSIRKINSGGEPWKETPFALDQHLIGVSRDHSLKAIALDGSTVQKSGQPVRNDDRDDEITAAFEANIAAILLESSEAEQIRNRDKFSKRLPYRQRKPRPDDAKMAPQLQATEWVYRNFAIGQGGPVAWKQKDQLLVAADGSLLTLFNATNGARAWSIGLADFPLAMPARQICRFENLVFATSQGVLRIIDIRQRETVKERFLGDATSQWQAMIAWTNLNHTQVVAKSIDRDNTPNVTGDVTVPPISALLAIWPIPMELGRDSTILLCEARHGEIVQRIRVDSTPHKVLIDRSGIGVIWTQKSLSGLRSLHD